MNPVGTIKFVRAWAENGGDAVAAVRTAFPRYSSASRATAIRRANLLMRQPEVIEKIHQLAEQDANVAEISKSWLLNRAKQVAEREPPKGQQFSSATMKALEFIGTVTGDYRPKQDVNVNHTLNLHEEREALKRLAILTEQARSLGILPSNTPMIDAEFEEVK